MSQACACFGHGLAALQGMPTAHHPFPLPIPRHIVLRIGWAPSGGKLAHRAYIRRKNDTFNNARRSTEVRTNEQVSIPSIRSATSFHLIRSDPQQLDTTSRIILMALIYHTEAGSTRSTPTFDRRGFLMRGMRSSGEHENVFQLCAPFCRSSTQIFHGVCFIPVALSSLPLDPRRPTCTSVGHTKSQVGLNPHLPCLRATTFVCRMGFNLLDNYVVCD